MPMDTSLVSIDIDCFPSSPITNLDAVSTFNITARTKIISFNEMVGIDSRMYNALNAADQALFML